MLIFSVSFLTMNMHIKMFFALVIIFFVLISLGPGLVYASQSPTAPSDISNYKYFGLQDRDFGNGFTHWKPGERNARNDGEPLTQQDIRNGKLWLRLYATTDITHYDFSVTTVTQGTPIHTAKETNNDYKLLGYNVTGSESPVDAILITKNNTAKWNDLFLYARIKLIRADVLTNTVNNIFSIGIVFNWQFEYYNYDQGKYYWSDFHNPDPFYGSRTDGTTVSGITSDIPINSQMFIPGVGWTKWIWLEQHQDSNWFSDVVINPLTKYAKKVDAGIWQTVKVNMSEYITDVFNMANEWIDNQYVFGESTTNADFTALALRGISIYIEGVNVDVEAIVDYVIFDAANPLALLKVYATNEGGTRDLPAPVWIDDLYRGQTPISIELTKTWHTIEVAIRFYDYKGVWKFKKWDGGLVGGSNVIAVDLSSGGLITKTARYYKLSIGTFFGGGGGGAPGVMFAPLELESPPPEFATHARLTSTNSTYTEKFVFAKARSTLGNNDSSFNLVTSAYHKNILLNAIGIERFDLDLGGIWRDSPYLKSWFGLVTAPMDDVTLYVQQDNVSRFDLHLKNVPSVIGVKHNGIDFAQWNYTNGDLYIWLYPWDHSQIFIDFETPYSLTYTVLIQSSTVLIAMLVVAWLYRKLQTL